MSPAGPELDPVIHVQARLRVVSTLAALHPTDRISFTRMQKLLEMTPGNLITHVRRLESAGYLTSTKSGSTTYLALTTQGRAAFERYVRTLRSLLEPAIGSDDTEPKGTP